MATIKDVALLAGVSTATVSHVLNDTRFVSNELRERVLSAIEELAYRPSQIATSLRTKRSQSILLIIPDISNAFFPPLVRGVQDAFDKAGFSIIVGNTDRRRDREVEFLNLAQRTQADGIIIIASEIGYEDLHPLAKEGIPAVLLGTHIEHPHLDVVRINNQAAAYEAVKHLIELGHRRIAIVFGPMSETSRRHRLNGYQQAMSEAGLPVAREWIVEDSFDPADGYTTFWRLLEHPQRPTAIFVAADIVALEVLRLLQQTQFRVPDDISLVGFDDIPATLYTNPPLTTVHQPTYDMGQRAADLLLARITEGNPAEPIAGQCVVMKHHLVVRASTAPPPHS